MLVRRISGSDRIIRPIGQQDMLALHSGPVTLDRVVILGRLLALYQTTDGSVRFYTHAQVARQLGISEHTLKRYRLDTAGTVTWHLRGRAIVMDDNDIESVWRYQRAKGWTS